MSRLLLFASLLLSTTTAASAASCLDEAARMAARYKLAFLAPTTAPHGDAPANPSAGAPAATADARGPLAAPDTKIAPGVTAPSAGPAAEGTAPNGTAPTATAPSTALDGVPAPPQIGSGSSTPAAEPPPLGPAERARMEETLSRARAAELAGQSDECFRQLREAQAIAEGNR